jgi:hypothetical protein
MCLPAGLQHTRGAVSTAVIDDDDLVVKLTIQAGTDLIDQQRDAFYLVKDRDDDT